MRRTFLSLLGAILLLVTGFLPANAIQEATPSSGLADAGLPTLDVTATAAGFEGIPESLVAGRYLLTVTAAEDTGEFGGSVAFVQPVGMTPEEFLGFLAGPPEDTGEAMASPVAELESTPVEGDAAMGGPPPALYDALFAGGAFAAPGQPGQAVIDLPAGQWFAWGDDPEAPQEPVIFEVTGDMPADIVDPESTATITMGEYIIEETAGRIVSGTQVIRVDNIGAQPHFIAWFQVPDGTTNDQVQAALDEEMQAEMSGTPPAYAELNPDEDLIPVTFTATQSMGTSMWIEVTLEPGTHALLCFFPDLSDGLPHAYHGMFNVIEVGE